MASVSKIRKCLPFSPLYLVRANQMAKDGLSVKRIAEVFGVSLGTFKLWLRTVPFLRELVDAGHQESKETYPKRFPKLSALQVRFLAVYSQVGSVVRAREITGIKAHYMWLGHDRDKNGYAEAFAEADRDARDRLLIEARRRAIEGTVKMKFWNGEPIMVDCDASDPKAQEISKGKYKKVYTETIYSDALLGKLLDNLHPSFLPKQMSIDHKHHLMTSIADASADRSDKSIVIDDDYIEVAYKQLQIQCNNDSTDNDNTDEIIDNDNSNKDSNEIIDTEIIDSNDNGDVFTKG